MRIFQVVEQGVAYRESDGTNPVIAAGEYIKVFPGVESARYEDADFDILLARRIIVLDPTLGDDGQRSLPPGRKFALLPADWRRQLATSEEGARN